jgi:acetamidase/formamidase
MTTHHIAPSRETLHGHYSKDLPPVLTIDPGSSVHLQTLDARWGLEPPRLEHVPLHRLPRLEGRQVFPRKPGLDDGHALCGPIAIRGAEAGMTLEVAIGKVCPEPWGWTIAGGWSTRLNERVGVTDSPELLIWELDSEHLVGRNQYGHQVQLNPFMGNMGMPPADPGIHSTGQPRNEGGNIDCKELVEGSTLYLPISVDNALFSVGDGHAAQGDGEVSSTAIECPMERVELTFRLKEDMRINTPRAQTPSGWITLGFHEDLDEAARIALTAMVDLLADHHNLRRSQALALASVVVDLRITQVVNGVCGVHALLPDKALL